jgi:hypothetical protein
MKYFFLNQFEHRLITGKIIKCLFRKNGHTLKKSRCLFPYQSLHDGSITLGPSSLGKHSRSIHSICFWFIPARKLIVFFALLAIHFPN